MTRTRWTGLAGALFGILFFCISIFGPSTPSNNIADAPTKYADYWSVGDHQTKARIGALLATYAAVLFVAFGAGLRDRLRAVDAGPLPSLCLAAATGAAALMAAGAGTGMCIGLAGADSSGFKADGNLALALDDASYVMLATGLMLGGALAVATAIITRRTRVLPAWTAWLGFLLGLSVVGSLFTAWTAFIGLPLWTLVIGVVLLLRNDADAPVATPA